MYLIDGDRTRYHPIARKLVAAWADRADLQPEYAKSDPFSSNALMKCVWLPAGLPMNSCLLGTGLPPTRRAIGGRVGLCCVQSLLLEYGKDVCPGPSLLRALGPGSLHPLSFLIVLLALLRLSLQPCKTNCNRNYVLPSAPIIAALYSPGGSCPRPLQPSSRHILQISLSSLPRTRRPVLRLGLT